MIEDDHFFIFQLYEPTNLNDTLSIQAEIKITKDKERIDVRLTILQPKNSSLSMKIHEYLYVFIHQY